LVPNAVQAGLCPGKLVERTLFVRSHSLLLTLMRVHLRMRAVGEPLLSSADFGSGTIE